MRREYLIDFFTKKGFKNLSDFAEEAGVKYSTLSSFAGKNPKSKSLGSDNLRQIATVFPDFDLYDFFGVERNNENSLFINSILKDHSKIQFMVPVKARAGYLNNYDDPGYVSDLEKAYVPLKKELGVEKRIFEVEGDSMNPTLLQDDLIVAEKNNEISELKSGRVYIFVTKRDGILIKRLSSIDFTRGKLYLKSDNEGLHKPIKLDLFEIIEIWNAKARVTYDLGKDEETEDRINRLERMIIDIRDQVGNEK